MEAGVFLLIVSYPVIFDKSYPGYYFFGLPESMDSLPLPTQKKILNDQCKRPEVSLWQKSFV